MQRRPDAAKAIGFAKVYSRSHDAVVRVYVDAGSVIETHEHKGSSKSGSRAFCLVEWSRHGPR